MKIEYPDDSITDASGSYEHAHSNSHTSVSKEGYEGEMVGNWKDEKHENIPLISVIVPICNVGRYVRKCLDSLLNQTMKQIEVICIDDGSTDDSGKIADEYVSYDWPKFRAIHTENRGLSAARNRGIDESLSDWIMFVDSDDWVEPGFCEIPYEVAIDNNADIVIFRGDEVKHCKVKKRKQIDIQAVMVDEFTAHEYGAVVVWNKLYKKSLFDAIRFPEGHVCEDAATTHKVVHMATSILILNNYLYHHVYRKESISRSGKCAMRRDKFYFMNERYNFLISCEYPKEKLNDSLYGAAISFLSTVPSSDDELFLLAKRIVNSIEIIPKSLSRKQRVGIQIWKINEQLFFKCAKVLYKYSGYLDL